jgi:co-chaperonin GroES (HSP10)
MAIQNDWKEKIKVLKLRPLGDQLVINIDEAIEKKGSIILPDESREHPRTGTVMFVGPDVKTVKVGDRVLFRAWDSMSTIIPDMPARFIIMPLCGVVAVVGE